VSELFAMKLVSESEMDIAKAGYLSASAAFDQSAASVRESRETLAKTAIFSPMDGVVSQLNSELGERVSGSTFTQGTEIMTIADLSRMEARVDVGENDVVLVSVGDTARIEVDAYQNRKFVGKVSQIANTAKTRGLGSQDEVTNFEVRILLDSPPDVHFRPGMSMTADIETETRHGVLSVPIQSVTVRMPKQDIASPQEPAEGEAQLMTQRSRKKEEDRLDEVVFVVKDGVAKTAKVTRGLSDDTYVEVEGDELEGMEVVSGPFRALNRELEDGSKVKVEESRIRRSGATVADNK
ncbi:MAG: efflux RND transporter periplasmic adaptor subunit, partial [Bacteroidota bacterium]